MLCLYCPMPVLSYKIDFHSFLTTLKIYAPKIPMKCSKKGQNFAMSKNTIDILFETCWTPCKKPHLSSWSWKKFTFFWYTLYFHSYSVALISNDCLEDAHSITGVNIQTSHPFLHRKYAGWAPILMKFRTSYVKT